jgi:beta-glucosidase
MNKFDHSFLWGVSTSAYQIEGAATEDNRGLSIWDTFCRTPDKIAHNDTGDVACDHYHRYEHDIALMKELGVGAYRFSVAWPRIYPEGKGRENRAGLDFYNRLVDTLLHQEIEPWVCFYHWDLPQALQDIGGWTNRDIASWFTDYAITVAERLGDRVRRFVMLNEPMVSAYLGHYLGIHAPGLTSAAAFLSAAHHLNLALGLGLTALRSLGGDWQLGTVVNMGPGIDAKGDDPEIVEIHDDIINWPYLDPVFLGRYPRHLEPLISPYVQTNDLTTIRHPLDFLGLNYYFPERIVRDASTDFGFRVVEAPTGTWKTAMDWEVRPESLREILVAMKRRIPNLPPVYITENGAAVHEKLDSEGRVDDQERIKFFEHYPTQRRIPKSSFYWYRDLIRGT